MNHSYHQARTSIVLFNRSDRGRLEILGPDRAKFLHNLTTNDIKRMVRGTGCEAFITNLQGKTLGYITVLADDPQLLVRTDPGALAGVLPHLQKYGVFDDVTLEDVGPSTFEFHIVGPKLSEISVGLIGDLPEKDLSHTRGLVGDRQVWFIREAPAGLPGLTLIGRIEDRDEVLREIHALGIEDGDLSAFDALRIEAGTPVYGRDVNPENLPQEIGRDLQAISFTKGCYLGQETVARLDALGHVNKLLKGLVFDQGAVPLLGSPLRFEGKPVGHVTSAATSPGRGTGVGLGIIRIAHIQPGTVLSLDVEGVERNATVCNLPFR